MAELIRLPNQIVNLDCVKQITFEGDTVILYWSFGQKTLLCGRDAAVLLYILEHRYGLMTDAVALLEEEVLTISEEKPVDALF